MQILHSQTCQNPPPGPQMTDTAPAKDSCNSHYQHTEPGITISVPEFSYGQRDQDYRKFENHNLAYTEEEKEGTVKRWDNGEGVGLLEKETNSLNTLGGGKKLGFAQVVRETMLKEKGVSSISQSSVINSVYYLEGTLYFEEASR